MSKPIALPSTLQSRLAALARRARLLQAIYGAGVLVVVLAIAAVVAMAIDFLFDLPPIVRWLELGAWSGLGIGLFVHRFFLPLFRRFDNAALASAVEKTYPDLGERLLSTVELVSRREDSHGSPAFVALLVAETEKKVKPLDFMPAVPGRAAAGFGIVALAILATLMVPSLAGSPEYDDLVHRFFRPWSALPPYTFQVTPGDVFAARGSSVLFTVTVQPRNTRIGLPPIASLVLTDADGKEASMRMRVDRSDTFSLPFTVTDDCEYRIEASAAVGDVVASSETFRVTAVTPVELAPESPSITVTPPDYARAAWNEETHTGLSDLIALQGSQVRFDLRFTHPAVNARLEWSEADIKMHRSGTKATTKTTDYALVLTDDGRAAELTLPATSTGGYRLVLEAEHGVLTEYEGGTLTVKPDLSPVILKFTGHEELKVVTPYEKVQMECSFTDDVGLAKADLEYRINDGEPLYESIKLPGVGRLEAAIQLQFALEGKVKDGDTIAYRLRVEDNFPTEMNGPHIVYSPADRWQSLKIAKQTSPIREQEIANQRDSLNQRIEAIRQSLLQEMRGLATLKLESRIDPDLTAEQRNALQSLESENRQTEKALRDLVQEADTPPALQPLSAKARDIADHEMQESEKALREAGSARKSPSDRDSSFQDADNRLSNALQKLDFLKEQNEQIAKDRADQLRVDALAEKQQTLADRAAELAKKDPAHDPSVKQETERLQFEQAEIANELQRLSEQSPVIQKSINEARAEQARQAADQARELAATQRKLMETQAKAEKDRGIARLAELAKKQQKLAEETAKIANETKQPTHIARSLPLRPDEARKAADALKEGNSKEAIRHQNQTAHDLDKLANDLEQALERARDPREAARQLAKLQDDLRQRLMDEKNRKDADKPLANRLVDIQREQEAIQKAAGQLSLPPQDESAKQDRQTATEKAAHAAELLKTQQPLPALGQMEQARRALEQLADRLPTLEQRQQQARQELAHIRQQQEDIAHQVEQATQQAKQDDPKARKQAIQKLTESAKQQAEVAEAANKIDTPNQEERRERTEAALNQALKDLMDGRSEDAGASQAQARRELERLEQALAGQKPADEKAHELAKQQRDLAAEAARAEKATPEKKQELQRKQQELAKKTSELRAPEAPQRQAEAVEMTQQAEKAAKVDPTSSETREKMEAAAHKLDELAKQMSGQESEAERVDRLAKRQAEAAEETEKQIKANSDSPQTPDSQRRQEEIAREAMQVHGGEEGQAAKRRAQAALEESQQALRPQERALAQKQAAEALRELADRLDNRKKTDKPDETSPQQMALQLAKEQRELAGETQQAQRAADKQGSPAGKQQLKDATEDLARKQDELNYRASELPASLAQRGLEQARSAMNQAREALGNQEATQANQKQLEAADALERLARLLPEKATPPIARNNPDDTASGLQGLPTKAQNEQIRQLVQEQRDLRNAVQKAAEAARTDNASPQNDPMGKLTKQQQDLQQQTDKLVDGLNDLADKMKQTPLASRAALQASDSARAASQQMQQSGDQQSQQQAARSLDRAAMQAAQAAAQQQANNNNASEGSPQTGQSMQQAHGQMQQANRQLGKGQTGEARQSMQDAAQALRQAAGQMVRSSQQEQPNQAGAPNEQSTASAGSAAAGGLPDSSLLGPYSQKYAGKTWGELPGELRTKIVQDMKAKYGEDYARMIKLYFEQLADTKHDGK